MRRSVAAVLVLLAPAGGVRAQQPAFTQPIDSGSLVRLTPSSGPTVVGRLLAPLTVASPVVRYCRYPGNPCTAYDSFNLRTRPLNEIAAVEITRSTHAQRGALIGGGIGLIIGLLNAAIIRGLCETRCPDPDWVVFASTSGGAMWGAIFGSTSHAWERAP